jgi:NADH:ubiquinone oxidoreductase subunit D
MLNDNRIFKERVKDIGIVSHIVAKDHAFSGVWLEEAEFLMI